MEQRLKSVAQALAETSDAVNTAIQKAGGAWQGGAADAATSAMGALRSFDDGMHFTSSLSGTRAFGQSDGSSFVRSNVPPVVDVGPPPNPVGLPVDVIRATEDYDRKQAAAKQAEHRAREVMQQYTSVTVERAAALTPLTPPPQVVLDTSAATTPGPQRVSHPRGSNPSPNPEPHDNGQPPEPSATSAPQPPGRAAASPGTPQARATDRTPSAQTTASAAAGQPGLPVPVDAGSPGSGDAARETMAQPGDRGMRPLGAHAEPGHQPTLGRDPLGQQPIESLRGRGVLPLHGGVGTAGGPSAVGIGGAATAREEDRERRTNYVLPTGEHFEPDHSAPLPDPLHAGWQVAPPVIGEESGDIEH
jgi:hypothetical protein